MKIQKANFKSES